MRDETKSRAQIISELQQFVAELEQDKAELQQLLLDNDESVREYFDIYFHAHDMVVSVDVKTETVLGCNRAVTEELGYSRSEIVGESIFKLYAHDSLEDGREQFRVIAEAGELHDAEQVLRQRDGGKINVSLNATSLRDEDGNLTLARFDWRDITRRAAEIGDLRAENRQLKERLHLNSLKHRQAFSDIITQDPAMYTVFRQVESIAGSENPVLITGETGVGKEKIAAIIHQLSERAGEFVPVNMAGLDDMLFSDTFFGHGKGAFTGADSARRGLIEQASGGTLFLDEIGDLGTESQMKLLRFLQDGEYRHLGEDAPIGSDVRIVAATNLTIDSLLESENFRSELFYRLETHHIHLPPLRERRGEFASSYPIFSIASQSRWERDYRSRRPNSLRCLRPTTSRETSENFRVW